MKMERICPTKPTKNYVCVRGKVDAPLIHHFTIDRFNEVLLNEKRADQSIANWLPVMDITSFVVSRRNAALLLGDYNSYRSQLSKRLLTVRKKLGRTSSKGKRYAAKAPVTAEDIGSDHEFTHLMLLSSERAWAHAMHMKSTHSTDAATEKITGSTRRHIISRLLKAYKNAHELLEVLNDRPASKTTDTDLLEARAYVSSLKGAVAFEKEQWRESLVSYSEARVIYSALLQSTKNDVFKELLTSTIDPSIRYSAYKSQISRTIPLSAIAQRCFPRDDPMIVGLIEKIDPGALNSESASAKENGDAIPEDMPKTITWRSRKVDLVDAAISLALASVSKASESLTTYLSSLSTNEKTPKDKAAAYDEVLIASQDAVDATKHAIDELVSEKVGQSDKRMQALQVTRTAVSYALVGWRVGRNRVLTGEHDGITLDTKPVKMPKKPRKDGKEWVAKEEGNGRRLARLREKVVIYDATLQSIDSVKELPGVAADEEFVNTLEDKRAYFQAIKCLTIARAHGLLSNRKNALALLVRAKELTENSSLASATTNPDKNSPPNLEITADDLTFLQTTLRGELWHFQALVDLENHHAALVAEAARHPRPGPLLENLDDYPVSGTVDLSNIVTYPPKVEPVPVKPIFLDVAWNYIEYPGRAKKVVESSSKVSAEPESSKDVDKAGGKKGWFGFGR